MSGFGVRKGVLIEKVPTKKMGALIVPPIHLPKVQSLGFLYGLGKETGEELFLENPSSSRISLRISTSLCKPRQVLFSRGPREQRRLQQDGVREAEHFTLLQLHCVFTL